MKKWQKIVSWIMCGVIISSLFLVDNLKVKAAGLVVPAAEYGIMELVGMGLAAAGYGGSLYKLNELNLGYEQDGMYGLYNETEFDYMKSMSIQTMNNYVVADSVNRVINSSSVDGVSVSMDWGNLNWDELTYQDYLSWAKTGVMVYDQTFGKGILSSLSKVLSGVVDITDTKLKELLNGAMYTGNYDGNFYPHTKSYTSSNYGYSNYETIATGRVCFVLNTYTTDGTQRYYSTYSKKPFIYESSGAMYSSPWKRSATLGYVDANLGTLYYVKDGLVKVEDFIKCKFPYPVFESTYYANKYLETGDDTGCLNKKASISTVAADSLVNALTQWDGKVIPAKAMTDAIVGVAGVTVPATTKDEDLPLVIDPAMAGVIASTLPIVDTATKEQVEAKAQEMVITIPNAKINKENFTKNLTTVFPFCVPFDLIRAVKCLEADGKAPRWEIPFVIKSLDYEYIFVIDMARYEEIAKVIRTFETLMFVGGLIVVTRPMIRG